MCVYGSSYCIFAANWSLFVREVELEPRKDNLRVHLSQGVCILSWPGNSCFNRLGIVKSSCSVSRANRFTQSDVVSHRSSKAEFWYQRSLTGGRVFTRDYARRR